MSGRALVLAAHGSRRDPAANALVRRHAAALRGRGLFDEVAVAFHQGEPGFGVVLDTLTSDAVTVVPVMTSAGHYSDVVLPDGLRRNRRYGEVRLRITPPVGTHAGLAALVARRVAALLRNRGLAREETALALVGHGTPRHAESRTATLALAEALRQRHVAGDVLTAFIDDDPPVAELLTRVHLPHLIVVPFFIGGSVHAVRDLPALLGHASAVGEPSLVREPSTVGERALSAASPELLIDDPIGTYEELPDLIADLARRHPPPHPRFTRRGGRTAPPATGTVHLVGAGPGDPGLITVHGLEALRQADVVVHDRLIAPELLREAPLEAEMIDAGKAPGATKLSQEEINALLVAHARLGKQVVRLKGGDPFVFGRGSEELGACRAADVPCIVVPGISSAIAGPAAAGIPVTARGLAASFAVVTAHRVGDAALSPGSLAALAATDTVVVLMGHSTLSTLARGLIAAGRDPATPAACVQEATTPNQRVTVATLGTIADAVERDGLRAPVVTVVGAVAALGAEGVGYAALVAPEAAAATA